MIAAKLIRQIESKLFNNPGFFEGLVEVSTVFKYKTEFDLALNWVNIEYFLRCYEYSTTSVSSAGELVLTSFPFESAQDLRLAKFLMINYYI